MSHATAKRRSARKSALPEAELRKLDALWRASNYLSVGQIYLLDNPLLRKPLDARARQAAAARPLGHDAGPELPLRAPEPRHQAARPEHDLRDRARDTAGPALVANAYLEGTYSEVYPDISQDEEGMKRLFKQFSFPGGIPSHVAPETPGLDPRGRRARLRAVARLRRGVRQPGPDRRVRRRRRRGRDRSARDGLARQQVPEPGARRLRAADPAPERLQDREPLLPGAHPEGRAREALRGLRLQAVLRRGRRARGDAPGDGRDARPVRRARSRRSGPTRASAGVRTRPTLADDRAAHAEGLDLPARDRRQAVRGLLAQPPGADGRHGRARARRDPRAVDEELPPGGALRRERAARCPSSPSSRRRASGG